MRERENLRKILLFLCFDSLEAHNNLKFSNSENKVLDLILIFILVSPHFLV